ncbi:MAG TPA: DMT family transporter [Rectinemataceae bacterium]|nr:DMT family transporter [Rectinemataceae bacterium]
MTAGSVGQIAALATAVAWTITALAFEHAAKRIGAIALNFLRLAVGFILLGLWGLATKGAFLPLDAPGGAWLWLSASGVAGLVIGDLLLFQAFIDVGSRVSMLVYASAPALTAVLGFAILGERLGAASLGGMALTLAGITLVVLGRGAPEGKDAPQDRAGSASAAAPAARRARGIVLAFGAALGQAGGLILSKIGAGHMDPFAGTQIRVSAAMLCFGIIVAVAGAGGGVISALRDRKAVASLTVGSFFGPFLGVSLSLLAVQSTKAGIAAAIMSIMPVLIIAPYALIYGERVKAREILGAIAAVAGVFVLFLV